MIGYKLVTIQHGKLWSWCNALLADGNTEYTPHLWTSPNKGCGPLCVFKTLKAAREHYLNAYDEQIWKVEYDPAGRVKRLVWYLDTDGKINGSTQLFKATALAKRVKLLKQVI